MCSAAWVGLFVISAVLVATFALPHLLELDVNSREPEPGKPLVPPLHGFWDPKVPGSATLAAVLIGLLGWLHLPRFALAARWPTLVVTTYVVGLAWLFALALVDGPSGISRVQEFPSEYLTTALAVDDVGAALRGFSDRIPYGQDDSWATHVSGHPPGALLFFVVLVRLGLDTPFAAGAAITVVAAAGAPAVLVALRGLGAEDAARRAAPFLVLTPAAVLMAVSGDAVFATVTAWGLALLALATAARTPARTAAWAVAAGAVLGYGVFLSYGLPLMGLVALALLAAARAWRPLPWAVGGALLVALVFGALGFWWWEGYQPLHDRYWAGIAAERPQSYWFLGNLGALAVSAGPMLGAGLACAVPRLRERLSGPAGSDRTVVLLALSAWAAVLAADVSRMSKSEVERIWLPFVPWLLLSLVLLPPRWRSSALAVQVVATLLLQQLVWTQW